jgi:hypothetical protein
LIALVAEVGISLTDHAELGALNPFAVECRYGFDDDGDALIDRDQLVNDCQAFRDALNAWLPM